MKKFISVMMVVIFVFGWTFVSCGNRAVLDPGNFTFNHVHITDCTEGHCFDIDKWWDNASGIEVRLADNHNGMFLSEGTYQLFETKSMCPYCND